MLRGSQSGAPTGRNALRRIRVRAIVSALQQESTGDAVHLTRDARAKLRGTVQRSAPSLTDVVFAELGHEAIRDGAIAKVVKSPATLFTEVAG